MIHNNELFEDSFQGPKINEQHTFVNLFKHKDFDILWNKRYYENISK